MYSAMPLTTSLRSQRCSRTSSNVGPSTSVYPLAPNLVYAKGHTMVCAAPLEGVIGSTLLTFPGHAASGRAKPVHDLGFLPFECPSDARRRTDLRLGLSDYNYARSKALPSSSGMGRVCGPPTMVHAGDSLGRELLYSIARLRLTTFALCFPTYAIAAVCNYSEDTLTPWLGPISNTYRDLSPFRCKIHVAIHDSRRCWTRGRTH
ncbi:hypothetical protein DAEQUDRAFT_730075 [Daedalea quercina L-15889]|uniref:Uncharacterized protein n=1 Tax=Daedalea quercina L-15889 TaxID=1314783 RepID=A0A165N510_9APHY|nr:hypothetical protein DAEQUDRAFT_730075 [Daedalea quercina L-15889]